MVAKFKIGDKVRFINFEDPQDDPPMTGTVITIEAEAIPPEIPTLYLVDVTNGPAFLVYEEDLAMLEERMAVPFAHDQSVNEFVVEVQRLLEFTEDPVIHDMSNDELLACIMQYAFINLDESTEKLKATMIYQRHKACMEARE